MVEAEVEGPPTAEGTKAKARARGKVVAEVKQLRILQGGFSLSTGIFLT